MMLHNIYTITIGRFAELESSKDINLLKRVNIWMPEKWIKKAYKRLLQDYNKIGNSNQVNKLIRKDLDKLGLLNKVTIQYPILVKLVELAAKYEQQELKDQIKVAYKAIYKRDPKTKFDYERINKDFKILIEKYKQRNIKVEDSKPLDFEQILINLELILAPVELRGKKLYTLPKYIELANKKIKQDGRD